MAKRTIQSCWKQFEKFYKDYQSDQKCKDTAIAAFGDLCTKANNDNICAGLKTLFVAPHYDLDLAVLFDLHLEDGKIALWQTMFDSEKKELYVNPFSILQFIEQIKEVDLESEDKENIIHFRWVSFCKEMSKIPSMFLLFMLVLQRVAYLLEIAHIEKRGGIVEVAEGEAYHTLLWAFKEFEAFARKTWGIELRSKYNILWYESEWITGR